MEILIKPSESKPSVVVKDGTYQAVLSDVRKFTNAYGERVGFEFTIQGGEYAGQKVMRSTAPQLSKLSKLAQVVEGVLGRDLTDAELSQGIDLGVVVGKPCQILVLQSKSKSGVVYSNVERVFN
jgi:hypothetical protein